MDPVASAEGDRPHGILRQVITEFQIGIIEEANQLLPNSKGISAGLASSAARQYRLAHPEDVSADFVEQRRSLLVA
jgi:hypothetical protein